MEHINSSEIVYRKDLYPRFEKNQERIQQYAEVTDQLPPIKINQDNILIDGFHRWKAFLTAGKEIIPCQIIQTESEKHLKRLAYQTNSSHGLQLSKDEKRSYANEMISEESAEEIGKVLGVSRQTIDNWTKTRRESLKEERDAKIADLYLRAENTQESIAELLGVTQPTVINVMENIKNAKISEFYKTFTPFLTNTWNTPKQDNTVKHFGAFPEIFMENLLHYHTEPLDIIFDPFAGGGTTVDVCKRMFRRYYCSDRKVIPGRESDIHEHDINNGLPENLPKPKFVFLDPPYWKQAENKYSDSPDDLGNMDLNKFNDSMAKLLKTLYMRKVENIAIVIQPTQYKNGFVWQDHIFDFAAMMTGYEISMRYILPYSTQQYNAQMVNKAKEMNRCLCLNRDLVIWKLK